MKGSQRTRIQEGLLAEEELLVTERVKLVLNPKRPHGY
jgi:hypothetical protein